MPSVICNHIMKVFIYRIKPSILFFTLLKYGYTTRVEFGSHLTVHSRISLAKDRADCVGNGNVCFLLSSNSKVYLEANFSSCISFCECKYNK